MNKSMLVIHCADTYPSMDIGAKEINGWHLARGWSGIGYALVIRRNGVLERGRDLDNDGDVTDETGAHARGYNRESIGVCLVGGRSFYNLPEPNFTPEQLTTLASTISLIRAKYPSIEVLGHRDLPEVKKACPCFDVGFWLESGELIK